MNHCLIPLVPSNVIKKGKSDRLLWDKMFLELTCNNFTNKIINKYIYLHLWHIYINVNNALMHKNASLYYNIYFM